MIQKHPGNRKQLNYIFRQLKEMLNESEKRIYLNSGFYENANLVKERLLQISCDDIENLLQSLPDKNEYPIRNPRGYIRTCLFNIVDRRNAICNTQQIRKKHDNGMMHQEYDFDALRACIG